MGDERAEPLAETAFSLCCMSQFLQVAGLAGSGDKPSYVHRLGHNHAVDS
jgi:hypothetical protein